MITGNLKFDDNYSQITWELVGIHFPHREAKRLPDDVVNYLACPLEIDPEADVDEHSGKPTREECAACKRRWLMQEAK